ncbi:MAG TPA: LPS assembly protein LptD [Acidobacteriota bacterium]|nr:LPS assembly protein LptD [Acidobacteriota bacterium]HNT18069.1 LPS assembly protein LptD [Acidobacteriota bacterium]HPA27518.1 LPS assembly protein LptD [Acidobacteriota bacterium]HQO21169.1 LPS assembly protein LptD [Acidobacteriota bacterium]HQQ47908.1 LPS assembly protein LptD [Acidobacteriota bacterium]
MKLKIALLALLFPVLALSQVTPIPWRPKPVKEKPAAKEPAPEKKAEGAEAKPDKFSLTFDSLTTISPDFYKAEGNVRFENADILLTADLILYDGAKETLHAEGNVTADFRDFTISGAALDYSLKEKTGTIHDAMGQEKSGDYTVIADTMKKTGEDWFEVEHGIFTSCNAAVPPWSLTITKGRFHIDHYAFLTNPAFRVRNVPVIYTPYLIWPIKPDRSTGFLLPTVGNSTEKGLSVGTAFYLAPKDWWDATLYYDYYEKAGNGFGMELRYAFTERDFGWMHGYYIHDDLSGRDRWDFTFSHIATLPRKWKLTADINLISDAYFWRDFQRDFSKSTRGNFDSRVFLSKPVLGGSFNMFLERGVDYYNIDDKVVERALPKLELRLPLTPVKWGLYGSLETSASALSRSVDDGRNISWKRLDFHPQFEYPLLTPPWIDIIPSLDLRETWYSEKEYADDDEEDITRRLAAFSLSIKGPRIYKRFGNGVKHVVEPFVEGQIASEKNGTNFPLYDEIDMYDRGGDLVRYGVRNRFYSKDGSLRAEAQVSQNRSYDLPLSFSEDDSSDYSPVILSFRYWPKKLFSFDFRLAYHPLTHRFEDRSLSVSFSTPKKEQFFRFSYYYSDNTAASGPSTIASKLEELHLNASLRMANGHMTVEPHLERDLVDKKWRNARLILWYHGSCYNIGLEAGRREIGPFRDTTVRFLVSLKQVGTIVDLFGGSENYNP